MSDQDIGSLARAMRASDSDRDRVVELLNAAYTEGRLSKAEYDDRLERVFSARTYADLDLLVADLPVPAVPGTPAVTQVAKVNGLAVGLLLGWAAVIPGILLVLLVLGMTMSARMPGPMH